jgi:hypothetical protein
VDAETSIDAREPLSRLACLLDADSLTTLHERDEVASVICQGTPPVRDSGFGVYPGRHRAGALTRFQHSLTQMFRR